MAHLRAVRWPRSESGHPRSGSARASSLVAPARRPRMTQAPLPRSLQCSLHPQRSPSLCLLHLLQTPSLLVTPPAVHLARRPSRPRHRPRESARASDVIAKSSSESVKLWTRLASPLQVALLLLEPVLETRQRDLQPAASIAPLARLPLRSDR